jgi:hypothetical protein
MSSARDLGLTTTQRVVSHKLDQLLTVQKVGPEAREALINSFEMMYECIPYAIEQGENPSNGKVLAKFLAAKGMNTAKFLGSNSINCGIAIVELLQSGSTAVEVSSSPAAAFLPAPVLAWGLATLDLIEVGNSCEFVQEATYQVFRKDSAYVTRRSSSAAGNLNRLP